MNSTSFRRAPPRATSLERRRSRPRARENSSHRLVSSLVSLAPTRARATDDMPRPRGGGGGRPRRINPRARGDDDDETSETSASRSDEDAFEDVRATDGFEDEEIDEDEAFNEEDEERFGEAFADDDDAYAVDAFDGAEEDARGERGENDDDLNALMDSDEDEGEDTPRASTRARVPAPRGAAEDEDEDARDLLSDEDDEGEVDDDARRVRMLDEVIGKRRGVRLDPRFRPIQNERVPENPMAIPVRLAEGEAPLTLKDVMASLGDGAVDKETAKRLAKIAKTKAVDAPLARPIQERIDRKAAYAETSKDVSKYQAVVKENREKRTLKFEPARNEMQRKDTLGALVADFTPKSDLEKEIAKVLSDAGHASAKDVVRGEMVEMNHLDVEDVKARQAKLAKMRAVLFYHEQKAKRLKAIKSKAFHRHNRKGELKIVGGDDDEDFQDGEGDTPEERREYLRAQERMLLRHKNTSRWAKRAIKKGIAHLAGTREKLQEQLRVGQRLKEKIEGSRGTTSDGDDDDESTDAESDDDDRGDGANDPVAERKRRLKAKAAALKAIEEGEDAVDGADESLFKLPFMARAMEKRKAETRAEAQRLLDELDEMENGSGESESESESDGAEWAAMTARAKSATDGATTSVAKRARADDGETVVAAEAKKKKKKKSAPKQPKAKPIDEIPNAARRMREKAARRVAPPKLEEDEDEPVVMLEEERSVGATNEDLMRRAFANDDIEAAFEKEKLADVDAELPETDVPKNLPGWGAWASEQRTPKWMQDAEKKAKAERAKALKNRRDAKLKHVVISEKFDKKAAQFNVESLPHGYASKATYEGSMRQPLGPDVNTSGMFSKLNAPKVLKPTGSIIKPLKLPKQKQKSAGHGKSKSKSKAR